jgi:hypothetical protein
VEPIVGTPGRSPYDQVIIFSEAEVEPIVSDVVTFGDEEVEPIVADVLTFLDEEVEPVIARARQSPYNQVVIFSDSEAEPIIVGTSGSSEKKLDQHPINRSTPREVQFPPRSAQPARQRVRRAPTESGGGGPIPASAPSKSVAIGNWQASMKEPDVFSRIASGYSNVLIPQWEMYERNAWPWTSRISPIQQAPGKRIEIPPPDVFGRLLEIAEASASAANSSGAVGTYFDADPNGYAYFRSEVIGSGGKPAARAAMAALQASPNDFFAFSLRSDDGSPATIEPGKKLILENREGSLFLLPGKNPVEVVAISPYSFTFKTLDGHFDPAGSMISFITEADVSGQVLLMHIGSTIPDSNPSLLYLLAPTIADMAWTRQAAAMRRWLDEHPTVDK